MNPDPTAVIHQTNSDYCDLISSLFANEISDFSSSKLTVENFMRQWLADEPKVVAFQERIQDIANRVSDFWTQRTSQLTKALFNLDGLKCTVGSDIFPFAVEQKLLAVGCYTDTFVVEDYIRRLAITDKRFSKRHATFGLVGFALELSRLEGLLRSDLERGCPIRC